MVSDKAAVSVEEIWRALQTVKDPEIPVVSVVEMGIVREIAQTDAGVRITITPTFAGCPALQVIKAEIIKCVHGLGAGDVEIVVALAPRWTTEWIGEEARAKLKAFGLAPPPRFLGKVNVFFEEPVACPYCGSNNTTLKNTFGSTLCRAIYYCQACQQPFEQFKPI